MMISLQNGMRQGHAQGHPVFMRESVKLDAPEQFVYTHGAEPEVSVIQPRLHSLDNIEVDEDTLLNRAHQEYKAGNYKQALKHCNLVHERSPRRTDALLLLGAIYYQLHDFDMCISKNEEAIRIDPQFAECYGNMANAFKEKGNVDLAIQYYLIAIELRPGFCDAWSNLASVYMRKGWLQEAAA